nr:hypothetical protein [Tanacetum cinerariifolium]
MVYESSITSQQTKLDLELVLKENRLDIGKFNGRIPHGLTPREPSFQVVLDALALTPSYSAFLIAADVPEMDQPWRTFVALINRSFSGKTSGPDKLQSTQIYGKLLPATLTSLEMKESKAYKTYLGYATDKEPVKKGKRVKRPTNKSTTKSATDTIIKETPMETKYKRKEKMDVDHGKGIELLPEVALDEKAQMKEVRKKSLRDFHRTHPSGSGIVVKKPPSVEKIKPTVTSKRTGDKLGVPNVTKDDSFESEAESWGNDEDDNNDENDSVSESNEEENESDDDETQSDNEKEVKEDDEEEDEFVHTLSSTDDQDDVNLKSKNDDETKRDEEKGMDARLSKPTQTDKEGVQDKEIDAEMIDAQQGNENKEITQEQVVEDAHVTTMNVRKETDE